MSAFSTGGGDQECAYKPNRNIKTGSIPNWKPLSNYDKKKVITETHKQGLKLDDGKGSNTGNNIDKLK